VNEKDYYISILNTYYESISKYAEKHFKKQDITVITNANVKLVKKNSLVYEDKNKNTIEIPTGLVVWSTGIDTVDLAKRLIIKLGDKQYNKRCIITDSRLRVLGETVVNNIPYSVKNIYSLGDCATVEIPKFNHKQLFSEADLNHDNKLSLKEFTQFCEQISKQIPALEPALKHPSRLFESLLINNSRTLSLSDFEWNNPNIINAAVPDTLIPAFKFRFLGSMAYLGGEEAAIDWGKGKYFAGVFTFWLWKSIYLSKQVSTRTRLALAFDWFKSYFFGRDTSQY
jgi:NADH dehydrogenase